MVPSLNHPLPKEKTKTKTKKNRHRRPRSGSHYPHSNDSSNHNPTPPNHKYHCCWPDPSAVDRLRRVVSEPHVESFNYFVDVGLDRAVADLEPMEVDLIDPQIQQQSQNQQQQQQQQQQSRGDLDLDMNNDDASVLRVWVENVALAPPSQPQSQPQQTRRNNNDPSSSSSRRKSNMNPTPPHGRRLRHGHGLGQDHDVSPLLPRECRERHLHYAGALTGTVCVQVIPRRNGVRLFGTTAGTACTTTMTGSGFGNGGGGGGAPIYRLPKVFGELPIMVRSSRCHLESMTPQQLAHAKEEQTELGGYFIVSGIERCVRLLQIPRRNYSAAIRRAAFAQRGPTYTDLGVSMRCSRANGDQSSVTNTLHALTTGGMTVRFSILKQEFLVPVVILLRALSRRRNHHPQHPQHLIQSTSSSSSSSPPSPNCGLTDEELYRRLLQGDTTNTFRTTRALLLLQDTRNNNNNNTNNASSSFSTPDHCLAYLGRRFRRLLRCSQTLDDVDVGQVLLRRYIMIHCARDPDKVEALLHMIRQLWSFAAGHCGENNPDSVQHHELLLPGHFLCAFIKEKFEEALHGSLRTAILNELRKDFGKVCAHMDQISYWNKWVDRAFAIGSGGSGSGGSIIAKRFQHFLSTGNLLSTTGLDLMQVSGYTIVAERLNFWRYCAHFRSVHRGQFFLNMKTTSVRKLLPDQWGYLCPVHTPDGGPCGLLSHLSIGCRVLSYPGRAMALATHSGGGGGDGSGGVEPLIQLLYSMGVAPVADATSSSSYRNLTVCVDGRVIGGASLMDCQRIAAQLREFKVMSPQTQPQAHDHDHSPPNKGTTTHEDNVVPEDAVAPNFPCGSGAATVVVPSTLEVALIPPGNAGAPYPGLYLFTGPARMIRAVLQRRTGRTEWIGPLEQCFMDIACLQEDIQPGITTHQELDPTHMLSLIANLTPFSDQNQSPRNMYQCQMGKQTMGTPCHSFPYRVDNKLYRLHTPQAPLVQTATQGLYQMDEYPHGANAIVAVISYTGFDMEDAMILNKASVERGFGHASMYKTIFIDPAEEAKTMMGASSASVKLGFRRKPTITTLSGGAWNNSTSTNNNYNNSTKNLDEDGFPAVGSRLEMGDALYSLTSTDPVVVSTLVRDKMVTYKDRDIAYVQSVRALGRYDPAESFTTTTPQQSQKPPPVPHPASLTLRIPRNPVVGDKFSSRHGQKGVLSILWPAEDMPFSESGMVPDLLINPHAFPSRMTIGMLVESMAGKSGALHGTYLDATPFTFHESSSSLVVDHVGEQLQAAGYNYYGSEALYSGVSGRVLQADLFMGVVFYQRLRHMVSDKYQVRATGVNNELTRQPIQGRQRGGGIRLGEMERDSLLSHGTAYLLQDRLMQCSDQHVAYVCTRCGDLLLASTERNTLQTAGQSALDATTRPKLRLYCRDPVCMKTQQQQQGGGGIEGDDNNNNADDDDDAVVPILLPYVYRYLVNELAGMNVRMKLKIR